MNIPGSIPYFLFAARLYNLCRLLGLQRQQTALFVICPPGGGFPALLLTKHFGIFPYEITSNNDEALGTEVMRLGRDCDKVIIDTVRINGCRDGLPSSSVFPSIINPWSAPRYHLRQRMRHYIDNLVGNEGPTNHRTLYITGINIEGCKPAHRNFPKIAFYPCDAVYKKNEPQIEVIKRSKLMKWLDGAGDFNPDELDLEAAISLVHR